MIIKQVTVIVENKEGKLKEVMDIITSQGINVHALSMADTVTRLIVDDPEGVKEILVTLSYDTSTDPLSFGDMWLFDKDSSGKYNEAELPLVKGENGAKCLTINYEEPDGCVIRYSIMEAGLTKSEDMGDDYVNYWWTEDATTMLRSVYWAEITEGTSPAIRCYVAPLPRGGESMGFNLSYRNGKYEIGYMELDSPGDFG